MRNLQLAILPQLACVGMALGGCASHLISLEGAGSDCEAGPCEHGQTSIMGAQVYNSDGANGYDRHPCGIDTDGDGRTDSEGGFTRVEVRRSFGQGLLNILTLGTVNRATIEYSCVRSKQVSDLQCDFVELGEGQPKVLQCTRTNPAPGEPVKYECDEQAEDAPEGKILFACETLGAASLPLFRPGHSLSLEG